MLLAEVSMLEMLDTELLRMGTVCTDDYRLDWYSYTQEISGVQASDQRADRQTGRQTDRYFLRRANEQSIKEIHGIMPCLQMNALGQCRPATSMEFIHC